MDDERMWTGLASPQSGSHRFDIRFFTIHPGIGHSQR